MRRSTAPTAAIIETGFLTNIRHQRLVEESLNCLEAAAHAVKRNIPHEMIMLDLYGALRPLDAITGELLWTYRAGDHIDSTPAIADGIIYVGSHDHRLYALDAITGEEYWDYTTGGIIDSSPTVAEGIVYIGSQDHTFYALSAQAGEKVWSYITAGGIVSSPAVANGVVYIGSNDHNLYAFNQTYFGSEELGKGVE